MRTQQQVLKELRTVEKEINSDPEHPTTVYLSKERTKLLKELQEVQMRDWKL